MADSRGKRSGEAFYRISDSGQTVVELLLYLGLIISLTLVLFPFLHQLRSTTTHDLVQLRLDREWQLFTQQLEREVNEAEWFDIQQGRLELGVNNQVVTYEQYGSMVRRRVAGQGHMIVCQYVSQLNWHLINDTLFQVEIILAWEGQKQTRIRKMALRAVSPIVSPEGHNL